jgi:anti-sigma-K factor RskA
MSNEEHIRLEELELFALGGLPEEEAAAMRAHVAACGECAMRLAQAHGNASSSSFSAKQKPPAGAIKTELTARIRANRETEARFGWPFRTKRPGMEERKKNMAADTKSSPWSWVLVPVALALAVVSFGLSWQNRKMADELKKERQVADTLIHDREEIEKLVSVLAAPETVTVKLAGTGDAASARGMVKYNGKMGALVYSAELPGLPAGQEYHMWLLPANGAPISAGAMGTGGSAKGRLWTADVPANTEAKMFAVTIEAADGVAQPTGPKVLVGAN